MNYTFSKFVSFQKVTLSGRFKSVARRIRFPR